MKGRGNRRRSSRPPTTWRARLLLVFGACLISLVAMELAVRLAGICEPPSYPPTCSRPELYEAHESYGYALHPSRVMQYDYPRHNPRRLSVVSNRFGFRDSHDPVSPHEGLRLMCLGDSFVFGEGVEQDERFGNVLQASHPAWRIDNLGMPGFGLDSFLRAFEKVGVEAPPDVLLICIYTDDFRRVRPHYAGAGFKIPRFRLRDGQLETIPYPSRHFWDSLHVVELARRVIWKLSDAEANLNRAILTRLLDLAESQGTQTALVFLPSAQDLPNDVMRREWLRRFAEQHDTPYLDLTDPLQRRVGEAFIDRNPHYNPIGHQIVADELDKFIADKVVAQFATTQSDKH